jgi:predicted Zn-ribbon and HTH transcriptional regulator
MKMKKTVTAYKCDKCGHEWVPRYGKAPKVCPKCKRETWNEGEKSE